MSYSDDDLEKMKRNLGVSGDDLVYYIEDAINDLDSPYQTIIILQLDKCWLEEITEIREKLDKWERGDDVEEDFKYLSLRYTQLVTSIPYCRWVRCVKGRNYKEGDILNAFPNYTITTDEHHELMKSNGIHK